MKNKCKIILLSGTLLFAMAFSACNKPAAIVADTQAAQDNTYAEGTYSDAFNAVDATARTNTSFFKTAETLDMLAGPSVTITFDSVSPTRKIIIDFGAGTVCKDGKTRSGQIIGTWTGRYRDQGTVITITFNNYTVNGDQVSGTKTVTNEGLNANGNIHYSIVVTGASIVTANGTISWASTRDREWVQGSNTPTIWDDVYNITGSASGTNIKGQTFQIDITKPIVIALACHYIESGTLTISTSASTSTGTIDYGDGSCSPNASFIFKGKTYNFLKR